jgi:hypothetical protein
LRVHYWIINPKIISKIFNQNGFEVNIVSRLIPYSKLKREKGNCFDLLENINE